MIQEIQTDLFRYVDQEVQDLNTCVFVMHCISHDLKMGAGIAKPMQDKFQIREQAPVLGLWTNRGEAFITPTVLKNLYILNLITKEFYYNKPTYNTLQQSLVVAENLIFQTMKDPVNVNKIPIVIAPKIGCGLDKLEWPKVKDVLLERFNKQWDTIICSL